MTTLAELRQRAARRTASAAVTCGALGVLTARGLSPGDYALLAPRGDRAVLYAACPELQEAGEALRQEGAVFAPDEIMRYVTDQEARIGAAAVAALSGMDGRAAAALRTEVDLSGPVPSGAAPGTRSAPGRPEESLTMLETRTAEQESSETGGALNGADAADSRLPGIPFHTPEQGGAVGPGRTAAPAVRDSSGSGVRTKEKPDSGGVGSDAGSDRRGLGDVRTDDRLSHTVRTDENVFPVVRTDRKAEIRLDAVQENKSGLPAIRPVNVQDPQLRTREKIRPTFVRQAVQKYSGQVSREFFNGAGASPPLPEMPKTAKPSKLPKSSKRMEKSQILGQNGQNKTQHLAGPLFGAEAKPGDADLLHDGGSEFVRPGQSCLHESISESAGSGRGKLHETESDFAVWKAGRLHETKSDFFAGRVDGMHESKSDFTPRQLQRLHELMSDFMDERDRLLHQAGRGAPRHPAWTEEEASAFAELLLEGLLRADASR